MAFDETICGREDPGLPAHERSYCSALGVCTNVSQRRQGSLEDLLLSRWGNPAFLIEYQTTNLGVRSSNLFGRARKI
jgi:hypothetical protein